MVRKTFLCNKVIKVYAQTVVDRLSLQQLEYGIYCADIPDDYNCFDLGYCGHFTFPFAHIQLEQATKLISSHFQEEDHSSIHDILKYKKISLITLYFVYRPNKNASRMNMHYLFIKAQDDTLF